MVSDQEDIIARSAAHYRHITCGVVDKLLAL